MHFTLFHNRRKQLLAEPFPVAWRDYLRRNMHPYGYLSADQQDRLHGITRVLIEEKNWEGCNGLVMSDEVRVTIAGMAALLLLGLEHDYYANVESILVYPDSYLATERVNQPGMVVTDVPSTRLGEAWNNNWPVIVSWPDALAGGRGESEGRNVVLHEFAHKLDFGQGGGDGVPRLRKDSDYDRWSKVMSTSFARHVQHTALGLYTVISPYGAKNAAEFFAVSTECFFENGPIMARAYPELYSVLRDYYGQDTRRWPMREQFGQA